MTIDRIEKVDLQAQIIREIKKHIYANQLTPGDPLPSQASIAELVGVSRASVREAVKTMEAHGLLRVVNGKGIYIESVDTSFFAGDLNKGYLLRQLADALSVRKALEGMAVEECTRRATDEQLRALSRLLSKVEQRYARGEEQAEFDLKFHQTLVSLSGNALLTHMLKNLLRHSSGIWNIESPDLRDILRASIPAHRAMMDLMLGRDAAGAARVHHDYMNREISLIREMET